MDLLAIVESPLRSDVDRPAWLETALDLRQLVLVLLEGGVVGVVVATPTTARTHDTWGGGGRVADVLPTAPFTTATPTNNDSASPTAVLAGLG